MRRTKFNELVTNSVLKTMFVALELDPNKYQYLLTQDADVSLEDALAFLGMLDNLYISMPEIRETLKKHRIVLAKL